MTDLVTGSFENGTLGRNPDEENTGKKTPKNEANEKPIPKGTNDILGQGAPASSDDDPEFREGRDL